MNDFYKHVLTYSARHKYKYKVIIINGVDAFGKSVIYHNGSAEPIKITADPPNVGKQFSRWEKNGVVASYDSTFSFYMSEKDVTVTAVYTDEDEEVEKQATAYIETVTPNKETNKLTFVAVLNVPEELTMKKAGLVAADSAEKANSEKWDYTKSSNKVTDSMKTFRYTWNKSNVGEGDTWYVRPYVTYEDADGVEATIYGDLVVATIDGIILWR